MSITTTASVIIRNQANEILFVKEGKKISYGLWNLPGGRFDPHENALQCAVREALEETGYLVHLDSLVGVYSFLSYNKYELMRFVFNATILKESAKLNNNEILDQAWISSASFLQFNNDCILAPEHLKMVLSDSKKNIHYPLSVLK